MTSQEQHNYDRRRVDTENRLDKLEKHQENTLEIVDSLNVNFKETLARVDGMAFVAKLFSGVMFAGFVLFGYSLLWYASNRDEVLNNHTDILTKLSTIIEVDHAKSQYLEVTVKEAKKECEDVKSQHSLDNNHTK